MRKPKAGGGWHAILYSLKKARQAGGLLAMWRALRAKNTCKTCALGMGGQKGGMVNEYGAFPEVCKKSFQAQSQDMLKAIDDGIFSQYSIEQLAARSAHELEHLGRLNKPLYAGPNDKHFKVIDWDTALHRVSEKFKVTEPDKSFFYFSGRSSNEAGFLTQLFARLYGTNNVNNCSYFCHQASGVGLTSVFGNSTATVQLEDVEHSDLIFVIGANPASNHPRFMRTLMNVRRRGGAVVVVNPLRERGLERFSVPSDVRSLLFSSKIADHYVQPHIAGDIAFLQGIAKYVIENNAVHEDFVHSYCDDWDIFKKNTQDISWQDICENSGLERDEIEKIGALYVNSKATVFAWAMGITHQKAGSDAVRMISNLAMMRGMVGQKNAGLLPLRGHSNIQGMGSMGVTPQLKKIIFDNLEKRLAGSGITLPQSKGLDTLECIEAAERGEIDCAWLLGGNLYESGPDLVAAQKAIEKIGLVCHLNTTLNKGHVVARGRETLILPVLARDEEVQPTTQESMFSYVRLSDGGSRRMRGPLSEVQICAQVARKVLGDGKGDKGGLPWAEMAEHASIRALIAEVIPGFSAMAEIDSSKKEFFIDGRRFDAPHFATASGKAQFFAIPLPQQDRNILRMMTVRSEGQYNSIIYDEYDRYRGQDRRDIIMLSSEDIQKMSLRIDQKVTIRNNTGEIHNYLVREADVKPGNAVMYYPEANVLVPRDRDPDSHTPAFKNIEITISADL